MPGKQLNGFTEVIKDDESLKLFLRKMGEFDSKFCELMMKGSDFTIRLEVRGVNGEILHCRIYSDEIDKPIATK